MFSNQKSQKIAKNRKKYLCILCDYNTCNLYDFNKHNLTVKHILLENQRDSNGIATEKSQEHLTKQNNHECAKCNKMYSDRSGLWRHKKKCIVNEIILYEQLDESHLENINFVLDEIPSNNSHNESIFTNEMIYEILKEFSNTNAQNTEFQSKLMEFMKEKPITHITNNITNNGNTNNIQINIDTFLNQYCKEAITMNDFINNIKVTNEEVFFMAKNGNKNGVIAVVTRLLDELKLIERSFHCTDAKRHTTYIKDESGWTKTQDQKDLKRLCNQIGLKCCIKSIDIRNSDPRYMQNGTKETVVYENICIETCGGRLGFEHNNTLATNYLENKYHIDKKEMMSAITQ